MNQPAVSRRSFLRLAAVGGAAGALGYTGHAQPGPAAPDPGAELVTPETQAAIDRGLASLARTQNEDGSFPDPNGRGAGGAAVGIAALCGLALMAGGHQPGRGRYGRTVSRVVDFVLAAGSGPTPGFLGGADTGGRLFTPPGQQGMYSHGFGCLFLAEVCGMLPSPARQRRVREVLEQAVAYTVAARNREGGWRYEPQPPFADVSVTVAQMMALRAARNAGLLVRKSVMDAGADFIRTCQQPDGGFSYYGRAGGGRQQGSAFARSAAAIVGLYSAGVYSGREVERGLRYVQQFAPTLRQLPLVEAPAQHYYYGHYYAALAMWTAGGEFWARWFPAVRDDLLARARNAGGTWNDSATGRGGAGYGAAYATAMSLIILQLPNNYLPILQK